MTGFRVGWLVTRNLQLAAVTVRNYDVVHAQLQLPQAHAVHGTPLLFVLPCLGDANTCYGWQQSALESRCAVIC